MADPLDSDSERRKGDRRAFFRGGRRDGDWPSSLTTAVRCPRCASTEARFIEATPETLFWECHSCRHPWSTSPEGQVVE